MEPSYRFFSRAADIEAQLARLAGEPVLGLDLEADSLHSYREKTCLVQISTAAENVILDPLTGAGPLAGLGELLADVRILKVFHGGDFDLRLLKRDYGFQVHNLFDTMIAAQFTGRDRVGLAALLDEMFGVQLDKRFQRADWSARPLRPDMLAYAALDTAHLLPLRERLEVELAAVGRLHWAREEFRLLEEVVPAAPSPPHCLDVKGAARLAPRQLAVLQSLLEFRDEAARRRDRPPFKVVSCDVLLAWAATPPHSREEVLQTPGANRTLLERSWQSVLEAVRRGEEVPENECPRVPERKRQPLTPAQDKLLRRLKHARQQAADQHGLAPGLLVNTATLERMTRERDQAAGNLGAYLKDWQREALAEDLLGVLGGRSP